VIWHVGKSKSASVVHDIQKWPDAELRGHQDQISVLNGLFDIVNWGIKWRSGYTVSLRLSDLLGRGRIVEVDGTDGRIIEVRNMQISETVNLAR
jgi:hypothetical protein